MHMYVIARANKDKLDRWINDVTAQYLPYEHDTGRVGALQLAVRPVQLLEIAFPENQLNEVLKIVRPNVNYKGRYVGILRRILHLEKHEHEIDNTLFYRVGNNDIAIQLVGIKKDAWKDGIEQI